MLIFIVAFIAGLIYFAPALVATSCHHPRLIRVWAINLAGFTIVGWVFALKETIDGVHHVYGKHSPEGNLLVQRFTFNRYFLVAIAAIGLLALSVAITVPQLAPPPPPPVRMAAGAARPGQCGEGQVMVQLNQTTHCLTANAATVRVRFDDDRSLSLDEANSPQYADKWTQAHQIVIIADPDAPDVAPTK